MNVHGDKYGFRQPFGATNSGAVLAAAGAGADRMADWDRMVPAGAVSRYGTGRKTGTIFRSVREIWSR